MLRRGNTKGQRTLLTNTRRATSLDRAETILDDLDGDVGSLGGWSRIHWHRRRGVMSKWRGTTPPVRLPADVPTSRHVSEEVFGSLDNIESLSR